MVGSANTDLIARIERVPEPGETIMGTEFRIGFGGKGANQAVMAARLGAHVVAVVKLGRDQFGDSTVRNFEEQGIDISHVSLVDGVSSGVAPIMVEEESGQNRIVVIPGANATLSPADVRAAAEDVRNCDVLICQLETPLAATVEAFRIAREGGAMTVLNPAPAAPLGEEVLALTDVLVPNESEAEALTGMPVGSVAEALSAARSLREKGPINVVVTLGERGAVGIDRDGEELRVEAEPVRAVDSTGAGDAFVGSLAYFLATGFGLRAATERACRIATRTVLAHGTQSSFPSREELDDFS